MNVLSSKRLLAAIVLLFIAGLSRAAVAATHSENFESASGNANAFSSPSGMYFSSSTSGFIFSTQFNSFFSPYISGKFSTTGCNGCFAPTMRVNWPSGQRSLVFGWGTQGYPAVKVTAFRGGQQVWLQNQSGTSGNGLYKQQFSRASANAGEYFDEVRITWPGGGQPGSGYGILLDNFTSIDAYAAPTGGGDNQSALAGTQYAAPLSVVVLDYQNHPVAGVSVEFVSPPTEGEDATVTFAATESNFDTDVTDEDGIAMSSMMTANGIEGPVLVDASTTPGFGNLTFHLHNRSADTLFTNGFE